MRLKTPPSRPPTTPQTGTASQPIKLRTVAEVVVPRSDRLRNAAALRVGEHPAGEIGDEAQAERSDQQRGVMPSLDQQPEHVLRLVGQQRQHHRGAADDDAAEPEQHAALGVGGQQTQAPPGEKMLERHEIPPGKAPFTL
jgi:hypothetical protein